jgi:hypothetical protein
VRSLLDASDGAFVGRLVSVSEAGGDQALYRFKLDQIVKGEFGGTEVVVRAPRDEARCGLRRTTPSLSVGVFVTRTDGEWSSSLCGQTDAAVLLAGADEPQGQAIKLVIGILIAAAVIAYSLWRLRRKNAAAAGSAQPPQPPA